MLEIKVDLILLLGDENYSFTGKDEVYKGGQTENFKKHR
jgi:hypothetical protein